MMNIPINRFNMVRKKDAELTGLPIFDFTESDSPFEDAGFNWLDLCTAAQLKLLNIHLEMDEKQNLIKGFVRDFGYRGVAPLYSLKEILANRS